MVSVIVVSYNTVEHLRRCLNALIDEADEVVVVDNASQDGSPDMVEQEFPWARLIRMEKNLGFGAANNLGMNAATQPLVLCLNSDCVAQSGSVTKLAAEFEDPDVIAVGGRLYGDDGELQSSCCSELTLWRVFCEQTLLEKVLPGSAFDTYWLSKELARRGEGPFEVAQVMGACLMMRQGERFDESYFLYCEDTELCHRLRQRGKILYVDAPFLHALGTSTQGRRGWAIAMYNLGKEKFFQKHHQRWKAWMCILLNRMGGMLRLFGVLMTGKWDRVGLWDEVVFGPIGGPALPPDARVRP